MLKRPSKTILAAYQKNKLRNKIKIEIETKYEMPLKPRQIKEDRTHNENQKIEVA